MACENQTRDKTSRKFRRWYLIADNGVVVFVSTHLTRDTMSPCHQCSSTKCIHYPLDESLAFSCMQYLPHIFSWENVAKYELEMLCDTLYHAILGTINTKIHPRLSLSCHAGIVSDELGSTCLPSENSGKVFDREPSPA